MENTEKVVIERTGCWQAIHEDESLVDANFTATYKGQSKEWGYCDCPLQYLPDEGEFDLELLLSPGYLTENMQNWLRSL